MPLGRLGLGLGIALSAVTVGASQSAGRTVWDGVYSQAQADRGAALYAKHCAMCHGPALTGADGPPLTGVEFVGNWNGLTLAELDDRIRMTMPPNDLGRLTAQERVDVIAHILHVAPLPAGPDELSRDAAQLRQITMLAAKP